MNKTEIYYILVHYHFNSMYFSVHNVSNRIQRINVTFKYTFKYHVSNIINKIENLCITRFALRREKCILGHGTRNAAGCLSHVQSAPIQPSLLG